MRISDKLAEILVKRSGKVSKAQLADLHTQSQKTHKPLQDLIIKNGLMSEVELTRAYAEELSVPFIEIPPHSVKYHTLKRLPEHVASRYRAVVFDIDNGDDSILIAVEDPNDQEAIEFLKKQLGPNIKLHVTTTGLLNSALERYNDLSNSDLSNVVTKQVVYFHPEVASSRALANAPDAEASVNYIIERAINMGASDIHIEPRLDHVVIRYRVDGSLREAHKIPLDNFDLLINYIKSAGKLDNQEIFSQRYGYWSLSLGDQRYGIRTSILPTIDGEKVVLHLVHESGKAPSIRDLGLWGKGLHKLKAAIVQPHGTIFVAGPVGSGKSMTLFGILSALNSPNINIATIEDPIEHRIVGANQVQIDHSKGLTLESSMQAVLAQDPNIIMLGKLHDTHASKLAIQTSISGHLVFASLPSVSAANAVKYLLDMSVEPFVVASNVHAVVGQRLPRRLCSVCREVIAVDKASLAHIENILGSLKSKDYKKLHELESLALDEGLGLLENASSKQLSTSSRSINRLWKAHEVGCKHCNHTGYRGRVGIFEVLVPSEDAQKAIMHESGVKDIDKEARDAGMLTMKQDGLIKALRGLTTLDEVLRVTTNVK